MNRNNLGNRADVADQLALQRRRVHRAISTRITALADDGLNAHAIAAHLGMPLHLINLVLRGATLGETPL